MNKNALLGYTSANTVFSCLRPRAAGMALCALLLCAAVALPAHAQSVSFAGLQTAVNTGSYNLNGPQGVAVDGAGNLYISDTVNLRVLEVTANCAGGACTSSIGAMPSQPTGLAVDKTGDVFVIGGNCNGCGFALEIPAGCTMTSCQIPIPISGGLLLPQAIVVDAAGDLFIADTNHSRVVEVPAGCTMTSCQTTVGVGLSNVYGVAVDTAGDVFIANGSNVLKVPAGCSMSSCQTTVGSGLSLATGVAVDVAGNVFIADFLAGDVVEVPAGGGAQSAVISGLNHPLQLALDGAGDLFVAVDGNNRVVELERIAPNFGYVNVGANGTLTLNYNISANDANPVNIFAASVVTQGAAGLDFTSVADSCLGFYVANANCSVQVQFAPQAPGLRQGAVQLAANIGTITTLLSGVGNAPAVAFPGGPQVTITSGYTNPAGLALDGAGDLFVGVGANSSSDQIIEFPAGGGSPVSIANDFHYPGGISIDGAGNLFAADQINNRVIEMRAGTFAQNIFASGLNNPSDVAVDGTGNLFIADTYNHRILEEPAVCATNSCPVVAYSQSGSYPDGIAIDAAENLFTNDGIGSALELPAVGVVTTLATDFASPEVERVDAADDLFIVDYFNNRVLEVPFGCTDSSCQVSVGSGIQGPFGVALDGAGDLYISSGGNNQVYEVQRSQAPTLAFPSTMVTTTSSAMTVALQSIGNQPLTFASFAASTNFIVDSGSTTCSTSAWLAPGATCNVGVDCAPASVGSLTGTLTITDNALNGTNATQSVPLSCTGATLNTTTSITGCTPNASTYGQSITCSVAVSASDTPTGTITWSNLSGCSTSTLSGGSASCTTSTEPVGTNSITAAYSGDTNNSASTSAAYLQVVNDATAATVVTSSTNPSVYGQSVTFTATISGQYGLIKKRGAHALGVHSEDVSGSVTWSANTGCGTTSVSSGNPGTATCTTSALPVGSDSVAATYSGDNSHSGSSGSVSQTVNQDATVTTITGCTPNASTYGQPITCTVTVAANAPGAGTPTGTVTWTNLSGCSTSPLSGGTASCTTSTEPVGTNSITAAYSGDTNNSASTSAAYLQVVNDATAATVVTSSTNPSVYGQSVTFTVTISGQYGLIKKRGAHSLGVHAEDVSGSVTWSTNTGCGTTLVTSGNPGTATCTTAVLPGGADTVTATYSGDSNHTGSSGSINQTVNQQTPTVAVTSVSPSSEIYGSGAAATVTATLSWTGGGTAATGGLSFASTAGGSYGAPSCTGASSPMTCTTTFTPTASDAVGTYDISSSYAGDSNYVAQTSQQFNNFSISDATAATVVTSGTNPSVYGQSVTFTATISGQYGLIKKGGARSLGIHAEDVSGTVTWSANTGCGTTSVTSGKPGTATCTTLALPVGNDSVTATYSGDSNHTGSSGSVSQTVNQDSTTTTITGCTPNASAYGQSITCTVTVAANAPGAGTPTGSITWANLSGCSTSTLSGGIATCTTSTEPAGTNSITATYSGDTNNSASTSAPYSQVVNKDNTTTTVTGCTPNPSNYGQSITCTATVAANTPGAGTPTGTITWSGLTGCSTSALSGGSATCSTTTEPVGANSITAAYGGDAFDNASTSAAYPQVVRSTATSTTVVSSANPSSYGQSVIFTASVAASTANITGTVSWSANTGCSAGAVSGSGDTVTATCTTSGLPVGTDAITATYSGDSNHMGSSGALSGGQVVNRASSATSITSNTPNPSTPSQAVTIAFKVTSTGTPTGSSKVTASTGESCTGSLASGSGSCAITFTTTGSRTLTAVYSGDSNHNPSTSAPVTQNVNGPVANLSPSSYNFGSVYNGKPASTTFTLSNTGNQTMTISSIATGNPGNDTDDFTEKNTCKSTLAAGMSCSITVTFTADTDVLGVNTATLIVTDNAHGSPQTAALSATVIDPLVTLSPSSLSFGSQKTGTTSAAKTITLTNSGLTTLTLGTLSISGNFAIASGTTCTNGATVAAGKTCKIYVTFIPTAKGADTGTLTITDNALNSPQSAGLSGTGD